MNLEHLDVIKSARSLDEDCQEGVKWELRKLEWILEEQLMSAEPKREAV